MFDSISRRWALRFLVCLIICMSFERVTVADGLTPAQLVSLKHVTSVVVSPTGGHVAYTLSVPRPVYTDNDGPSWNELHVIDREGISRPFVTCEVNV